MSNKAHSTVINRLLVRYQGTLTDHNPIDVIAGDMHIAVETTATLPLHLPELLGKTGTIYIAATNQDALTDALRLTKDTPLGVMNSRGDIQKPAGNSDPPLFGTPGRGPG